MPKHASIWLPMLATRQGVALGRESGMETLVRRPRVLTALLRAATAGARGFGLNALFAYNVYAGLALLLHLLRSRRQLGAMGMSSLVGEAALRFRVPAARTALFIGGSSLVIKAIEELLHQFQTRGPVPLAGAKTALAASGTALSDKDSSPSLEWDGDALSMEESVQPHAATPWLDGKLDGAASVAPSLGRTPSQADGTLAGAVRLGLEALEHHWPEHLAVFAGSAVAVGVSSLALTPATRGSLALNALARALHVLWRGLRGAGALQGMLISSAEEPAVQQVAMAACTSVIMWAYVMRPGALDPSLRRFMVNTAPVDPIALRAAAASACGNPVDVAELNAYLSAVAPDWQARWGEGRLGANRTSSESRPAPGSASGAAPVSPPWWPADLGPPGEAGMSWAQWASVVRREGLAAASPFHPAKPGKLRELAVWLRARQPSGARSGVQSPYKPYASSPQGLPPTPADSTPASSEALPVAGNKLSMATAFVLRPHQPVALLHWLETFSSAARTSFPLYLVLGAVPSAAFGMSRLAADPLAWAKGVLTTAARSSLYISSFVTVYMAAIDVHARYIAPRAGGPGHRVSHFVYLGAGLLSSLTTGIERPSRRAELLMYCFGRALEVLASVAGPSAAALPHWDAVLLGLSAAVLVHAHRYRPELLGSLPKTVLDTLLGKSDKSASRGRPVSDASVV